MRLALIEASHWHCPLYLDAFEDPGIDVVGVSDASGAKGPAIAARFGARSYASYAELLARETVDVAFAFGRHCEMPAIAEALIGRGIPFAIEKPCGTSADAISRIRRMADERGVYVAVPFIFRFSELLAGLSETEGEIPGAFHHVSFRFVAGSPQRYPAAGSPWMLDPGAAGGGCLINLGVHFIDLFRLLTGREVTSVAAMTTSVPFGSAIEEFAVVMLTDSGGTTGVIETGYTFPSAPAEQREFSFTLSSDRNYYRSGGDALEVRRRSAPGESTVRPVRLETDLYYPVFARRVIADIRNGGQPLAGLAEAEAVMRVIDAAYASARSAGEPQTLRPAGGAK